MSTRFGKLLEMLLWRISTILLSDVPMGVRWLPHRRSPPWGSSRTPSPVVWHLQSRPPEARKMVQHFPIFNNSWKKYWSNNFWKCWNVGSSFFENVGLLFLIMLLKNYWGFGVLTLALQVNSDFALIFSTLCPCFPNWRLSLPLFRWKYFMVSSIWLWNDNFTHRPPPGAHSSSSSMWDSGRQVGGGDEGGESYATLHGRRARTVEVIDALPSENWNLFTLLRAHHGGDHDGRACSNSNYILAKLRNCHVDSR
jgi:hypothetical protein